ncbi:MAG: phospho-N-acetylmuramoyl-pentapeptide-transferase [Lachnospiraceae bacterium]|nr:phospho-N-acetylmuramoyl-pentapeptide-transferase [Lachnospiraceae bacterium]
MLFELLGVNPHGYNRYAVLLAIGSVGFICTALLLRFMKDALPADGGRAFAVNREKSKGKPRGAGIIFILVFAVLSALFLPVKVEDLLYIGAIVLGMLSGFLDDASEHPWNEYKKGFLDFLIAAGVTATYIWSNGPVVRLLLVRDGNSPKSITLPVWLFAILSIILIWVAINVVNCTDGVDALSGTLSVIATASFLFALPFLRPAITTERPVGLCVILISCLLAYLWYNCPPSILMMGDAGSRAIGLFLAILALRTDPLLFIPFCCIFILDGGLGLIKVSLKRFLKISIMKNIRTPLHDHARKKAGWSDTQTVYRFMLLQVMISGLFFLAAFWVR